MASFMMGEPGIDFGAELTNNSWEATVEEIHQFAEDVERSIALYEKQKNKRLALLRAAQAKRSVATPQLLRC